MIIIYDKPNTLTLHYADEAKKVRKIKFVPGKNEIASEVWDAICKYNEKRMEHYERYLHPLNEVAANDDGLDYHALNAREVAELVENTMDINELESYSDLENAREKGPRKSVLSDIDKQIGKIAEFEKKVEEGE